MAEGIAEVCLYYHKLPEEVRELTIGAFNILIRTLGKEVNWRVQLMGIPVAGKADMQYHPLHPSIARLKETKRLTTMNKGSLDDFIGKLNSL